MYAYALVREIQMSNCETVKLWDCRTARHHCIAKMGITFQLSKEPIFYYSRKHRLQNQKEFFSRRLFIQQKRATPYSMIDRMFIGNLILISFFL